MGLMEKEDAIKALQVILVLAIMIVTEHCVDNVFWLVTAIMVLQWIKEWSYKDAKETTIVHKYNNYSLDNKKNKKPSIYNTSDNFKHYPFPNGEVIEFEEELYQYVDEDGEWHELF